MTLAAVPVFHIPDGKVAAHAPAGFQPGRDHPGVGHRQAHAAPAPPPRREHVPDGHREHGEQEECVAREIEHGLHVKQASSVVPNQRASRSRGTGVAEHGRTALPEGERRTTLGGWPGSLAPRSGACATPDLEPRQDRKVAALRGSCRVHGYSGSRWD